MTRCATFETDTNYTILIDTDFRYQAQMQYFLIQRNTSRPFHDFHPNRAKRMYFKNILS